MEKLSRLKQGEWVQIVDIPQSCPLRIPLQQFGITPGSALFCRYCSPGGELIAIECEGGVVALRVKELSEITVRRCS
jgi:Fe2+ transport system protein FeoA